MEILQVVVGLIFLAGVIWLIVIGLRLLRKRQSPITKVEPEQKPSKQPSTADELIDAALAEETKQSIQKSREAAIELSNARRLNQASIDRQTAERFRKEAYNRDTNANAGK